MRTALRQLESKIAGPRKLLLLSLDWTRPKDPPLSLGHASILTHLKQKEVEVIPQSWSVTAKDFNVERILASMSGEIKAKNVDIGLGAFVWNESSVQKITQELKSSGFSGRIILGGSQISYTKKDIEEYYPHADVFIRGYAEEVLSKLMLSPFAYPPIQGVHYATQPDLGLSATADLENLPSPYLSGMIKPQPFIRWETQRGCPFRCAFCQHRESDVSMTRRQFSDSRLHQEVDFFTQHDIIQDIAVLDPIFNSGPSYLNILQRFIDRRYTGKLALQCRLEMVRKPFLDLVEELNKTATVVLEFGLQTIHREEERHIQRPNNMKKVKAIFEETHKRRIKTEVSLIFGLPGQTVQSFQETVNFCKNLHVPVIYAYPLQLHRGTPLYDKKKELALVESTDEDIQIREFLDDEHIGHVIQSPSFSREDWVAMAKITRSLDDYNAENQVKHAMPIVPKMSNTLRHTFWNQSKTSKQLQEKLADNIEQVLKNR